MHIFLSFLWCSTCLPVTITRQVCHDAVPDVICAVSCMNTDQRKPTRQSQNTHPSHLLYSNSRLINRMAHCLATNSSMVEALASHRTSSKSRLESESRGALVVKASLRLSRGTLRHCCWAPELLPLSGTPDELLFCWDAEIPITGFLFFTKKNSCNG